MKQPYYPRLRFEMTVRQITNNDLAEAAKVSPYTIWKRLSGKIEWRLCEVEAIRDKLFPDLCIEDLMKRRDCNGY